MDGKGCGIKLGPSKGGKDNLWAQVRKLQWKDAHHGKRKLGRLPSPRTTEKVNGGGAEKIFRKFFQTNMNSQRVGRLPLGLWFKNWKKRKKDKDC